MHKTLTKEDISLIVNLYRSIDRFSESEIRTIYDNIDINQIVCATINEDKITSLIITNIIKNDYYLEDAIFVNNDPNEIESLLNYTIQVLRSDERGLTIIYDNFPYNELMHKLMINTGFKCNFINYVNDPLNQKIELIKNNISINDKSEDVREYIYNKYCESIKSNDTYLGISSPLPKIDDIHLDNTNVAVIRNDERKVIGVARFGIISDSLYVNSLYAEDEKTYLDLLTLINNLTNKKIEIGIFPIRNDLIDLFNKIDFKKYQADYILRLS